MPQALRLAMLRLARRPALHQPVPGDQETGTSTDTADVADGLQEAWRRPMHWAGFLAMGASTCLPTSDAKEGGAGMNGVDHSTPAHSFFLGPTVINIH